MSNNAEKSTGLSLSLPEYELSISLEGKVTVLNNGLEYPIPLDPTIGIILYVLSIQLSGNVALSGLRHEALYNLLRQIEPTNKAEDK